MSTTRSTTADDLMTAINALGLHAQWAWTGGNCRAVLVQNAPLVAGPHVLITHEWDPFTDDDLVEDLAGQTLALGLYSDAEDDEPAMRVDTVTDSQRIAQAAASLLSSSR